MCCDEVGYKVKRSRHVHWKEVSCGERFSKVGRKFSRILYRELEEAQ